MSVRKIKEKVDAMTRVIEHLYQENQHLTQLSVGTLETIKLMPGYDKAIDELKKAAEEDNEAPKLELEEGK